MKAQCWSPSRRDLLKGLASAAAILPAGSLLAQATKKTAGAANRRIEIIWVPAGATY